MLPATESGVCWQGVGTVPGPGLPDGSPTAGDLLPGLPQSQRLPHLAQWRWVWHVGVKFESG